MPTPAETTSEPPASSPGDLAGAYTMDSPSQDSDATTPGSMTGPSAYANGGLAFDQEAAMKGLALLQLQAVASAPHLQPSWVYRRVQQLEFLDTRAVKWRVSVDFEVPTSAPTVRLGGQVFHLVPIASLAKTNLVAFSLRDEQDTAVWMPTATENTHYLASALVYWASQRLKRSPANLPTQLVKEIWRTVSSRPSEMATKPTALGLAAALIDGRRRHRRAVRSLLDRQEALALIPRRHVLARVRVRRQCTRARREFDVSLRARNAAGESFVGLEEDIRLLAYRLMASKDFRSQVEELAQNFVVHVGTNTPPGSRRIIKLSYEGEFRFARPERPFYRLLQRLGWRCWRVDVLIGGRGGSHHLEVAAPRGVDVVGITADPVAVKGDGAIATQQSHRSWWRRLGAMTRAVSSMARWRRLIVWEPAAAFSVSGYTPRVHINPPDAAFIRYRAAIFVRVSRPGWLTASWLVTLVIGSAIWVGRLNLGELYPQRATAEAGTAATLLLALLGVVATMLVRPGEHPLAARLLLVARLLILIQVAVVLIAVGNLVVHRIQHEVPAALWTSLAIVAAAATIMFTGSWVMPLALRSHREL